MKYQTAENIINKLGQGKVVKLKKHTYGGLPSVTWCMLCSVFFNTGSTKANYEPINDNKIMIYKNCLAVGIVELY